MCYFNGLKSRESKRQTEIWFISLVHFPLPKMARGRPGQIQVPRTPSKSPLVVAETRELLLLRVWLAGSKGPSGGSKTVTMHPEGRCQHQKALISHSTKHSALCTSHGSFSVVLCVFIMVNFFNQTNIILFHDFCFSGKTIDWSSHQSSTYSPASFLYWMGF